MLIKRSITSVYHHNFSIAKAGLVAIFVSARCRARRQTNSRSDEDLRVEIDHAPLHGRPLARRTNLFNTPSAFNGSQMQGLQKTVVFLTVLSAGEHVISLTPKTSAFIEEIDIRELSGEQSVSFSIENRAEDGDRRPWYTFVLVDLPLQSMNVEATINRRRRDSDDIKLIINGESRKQNQSVLHRFWLWAGSLLRATKQGTVRERYALQTNLPVGVHYVEFYADRTPILHAVSFALNETETSAEARARAIIVHYAPLIKAAAREFEVEPAMVGVALFIGWLSLLISIYWVGGVEERQEADAIVVLGASQWNGQPSPMFRARLDKALALYNNGYAPVIVLTGGVGAGEKLSEARVGSDYLRARGVPANVIFLEERGRTSWQSLRAAADIFTQQRVRSVLLVSHDFHVFRLKRMARDLGLTPLAAPVLSKRRLSKWRYIMRESVVYVLYRLLKV